MDHTDALPDDALADILSRLPPRDLASSRCVRKAWLAVVDTHRLLLPRSVYGLIVNYRDYKPSHLFARPSAAQAAINLSFLPDYRHGIQTFVDHCNGLLLCWNFLRTLCVVNPATRQWEYVEWNDENNNPYVVFDPVASSDYEVFSIPKSLWEQYKQKSDLSTSSESSSIESKGEQDDPHDLIELPPTVWTLNVFSSSTRQWKMRSFIREDDVVGTMTDIRLDPLQSICWQHWGGPRWRYSAYWRGSLYVHCNDAFVVRLSLSDCKYQLIKTPIDTEKTKHAQFLGKSEKGLYLATIHGRCQLLVWSLTESRGRIDWVLKHDIDLEPLSVVSLHGLQSFDKTWTIADDYDVDWYYNYYHDEKEEDDDDDDNDDYDDDEKKEEEEDVDAEVDVEVEEEHDEEEDDNEEEVQNENNEMVASKDHEWDSDDDNILNIEDYDTRYSKITFLGFHPYKEVVFLALPSFLGVAYHLKSSKVQYLGELRAKDHHHAPTNGIYESFPYTPCMIGGELLEHA